VEGGKVGFAKHNGTCECADRIARIGAGANAPNGAGRPPIACLCAAEKRSGAGPRAKRASFI